MADNAQTNGLLGLLNTVSTQAKYIVASVSECKAGGGDLDAFVTKLGVDVTSGKVATLQFGAQASNMLIVQILEDSPPDCIDALLDAAVGQLRVVCNQITEAPKNDDSQPSWVRRGAAHCEAVSSGTEFAEKYAVAEEELMSYKTAIKRGEKVPWLSSDASPFMCSCANVVRTWKMQMLRSKSLASG